MYDHPVIIAIPANINCVVNVCIRREEWVVLGWRIYYIDTNYYILLL